MSRFGSILKNTNKFKTFNQSLNYKAPVKLEYKSDNQTNYNTVIISGIKWVGIYTCLYIWISNIRIKHKTDLFQKLQNNAVIQNLEN
jgi:hypothetical protein